MHLITQKGKPIADNDQTETDYTCSRITTNPPQSEKKVSPSSTTQTATENGPDLWAGYKVETKSEVVPTNSAVIKISIISGFKDK